VPLQKSLFIKRKPRPSAKVLMQELLARVRIARRPPRPIALVAPAAAAGIMTSRQDGPPEPQNFEEEL
jgi:hypothetical protein